MRLLATLHDARELYRIRTLLRTRGIPTYQINAAFRGASRYKLFVCIDGQIDDALMLLRDPAHVPRHPVDAQAFEASMEEGTDLTLLTRYTIWALVLAVVFFALVWLVTRYVLH